LGIRFNGDGSGMEGVFLGKGFLKRAEFGVTKRGLPKFLKRRGSAF